VFGISTSNSSSYDRRRQFYLKEDIRYAQLALLFSSMPVAAFFYNDLLLFQSVEPVLRKEVVIDGPASRPLRSAVRGGRLDYSERKRRATESSIAGEPSISRRSSRSRG